MRRLRRVDHRLELCPVYLAITVLVCVGKHVLDVLFGHLEEGIVREVIKKNIMKVWILSKLL